MSTTIQADEIPSPVQQQVAHRSISQTLTFFLQHKPARMLMPFVFGLIYAFPVPVIGPAIGSLVGSIPLRGWRLNIVRQMVRREREFLPPLSQFWNLFRDGFILFLMQGLYWAPHAVLIALFSSDWTTLAWQVWEWGAAQAWGTPSAAGTLPLSEVLLSGIGSIAVAIPFHVLFWFITWPIYRIGMLRFAYTRDWRCFLQIQKNTVTSLRRNYFQILKLLLGMFIVESFVSLIGSLVIGMNIILPIFGICVTLVEPLLQPLSYTATGYLWGSIAQELKANGALD